MATRSLPVKRIGSTFIVGAVMLGASAVLNYLVYQRGPHPTEDFRVLGDFMAIRYAGAVLPLLLAVLRRSGERTP
jgi:multisubunit Na+/H+ antiporter MnhB subunit